MVTILYHPTLLDRNPDKAIELEQRYGHQVTVSHPDHVRTERRPAPRRPTRRTPWQPTGGDAA